MGWFFTRGATRRDVIDELLREGTSDAGTFCRALRHCLRGNVMYVLHESGPREGVRRWVGVYLLDREKDYGWGYKPMDESVGPLYYNCPVSYLDEADEPVNETAARWRAEVRRLAARRRELRRGTR